MRAKVGAGRRWPPVLRRRAARPSAMPQRLAPPAIPGGVVMGAEAPCPRPSAQTGRDPAGGTVTAPPGERYFQIGFKHCGTTALAAFFNRCGIPCVHHDKGRLARRMRANLAAGRAPLDGYDHRYAAFTNMDFQSPVDHFDGFKHFDALRAVYGGKFILNTRPVEHWIESVMRRAGRRRPRAAHAARFGTDDPERVAACWRAEWEAHHRRVRSEIPAAFLLVFDIESDPPERLCDFVGVPHSCARFLTLENPSLNRLGTTLDAILPGPVKRGVPGRIKYPLKKLLRRRHREHGKTRCDR